MPVMTIARSVRRSGTACFCMFEPIRARLASLCSRNGMRLAETPTIWFGATLAYSMVFGSASRKSPLRREMALASTILPELLRRMSAGPIQRSISSSARSCTISSVTTPLLTR